MHTEKGNDNAGKADHRPHREIELAGDHQETGADGNNGELGGNHAPVHDAVGCEHPRTAGHDREIDENENGSRHGPKFGPDKGPPQAGLFAQALIALRHCRRLFCHGNFPRVERAASAPDHRNWGRAWARPPES